MKRNILIAAVLFGGMALMTACEKENQPSGIPEEGLMLTTEGYSSDSKTVVEGNTVHWRNGDKVIINGSRYNVTVTSDGNAFVSCSTFVNNTLYGYFGIDRTGIVNGTTTTPTVTIPGSYLSSVNGTVQSIDLPMAAYSNNVGSAVQFKNLTAAVNVIMRNDMQSNLFIDRVVVKSDSYRLWGDVTLNLTANNFGLAAATTNVDSEKEVEVYLGGYLTVEPGSNNTKSVQVPILPIGSGNLTIEIYCHDANDITYKYSHTASNGALARNYMLTAGAKLDLDLAGNGGHLSFTGTVVNLSQATSDIRATDGDILTGTLPSGYNVSVPNDATVTLYNATIAPSSGKSGISCQANTTLVLMGENNVTGAPYFAGITIKQYQALTIKGDGMLTANGGTRSAGIGAGYGENSYCGNISILGGTVNAQGGSNDNSWEGGAGIGCASGADWKCGTITISGGTVTAIGGRSAAGIGSATGNFNGCGNILIDGGTVVATGGAGSGYKSGAGIGTGGYNDIDSYPQCGTITITNNVTSVTATKGGGSNPAINSIGKAKAGASCGTITIGGTVYWDGSAYQNGGDDVATGIVHSPYSYQP